ncbi:DUF2795 domain-containing protein [Microbacterium esteraromaticum]|uniref:DUF2795 domain-containing protein n=1 Tax=Microbacterium esteraromaticum TaxID=57043 RepID=UPI001956592B|nr:DUF2795 domain-containing protein [Microbacterium esteraromaticum]MBM7465581.1 hypothetical protein [Microbacterium esteraromaticum]
MSLSMSLQRFLAGMEFPATKDDLVREAMRDGLDSDDIRMLMQLDHDSYDARWQVRLSLVASADSALVAA